MNGTLQEIGAAGYKRIWKIVSNDSDNSKTPFMSRAYELNMIFQNFKLVPYSIMRFWQSIDRLSDNEAGGLKRLMQEALTWVSYVDKIDEASQRKFRHNWNTLWSNFANAVGLSDYDKEVISSLGLKLPLFLSAVEHDDADAKKLIKNAENYPLVANLDIDIHKPNALFDNLDSVRVVCEFYNLVFGWYCSVRNERDAEELIDYLVTSNFEEFEDFFKTGERVWTSEEA